MHLDLEIHCRSKHLCRAKSRVQPDAIEFDTDRDDFDEEPAQLFDFELDPDNQNADDEDVLETEFVEDQPKTKRGRKRRERAKEN